jgi:hypothetical protein
MERLELFGSPCIGPTCDKRPYCLAHNSPVSTCPMNQKRRQQRGDDFEAEVRRSWRLIPNSWRIKIPGSRSTRPADELILLSKCSLLVDEKRTQSDRFQLSYLRPNQITGLTLFERPIPERNRGLVLVSFLSEAEGRDLAYGIRLTDAIKAMQKQGRRYLTLDEVRRYFPPMARLQLEDGPAWDLKEVVYHYSGTLF